MKSSLHLSTWMKLIPTQKGNTYFGNSRLQQATVNVTTETYVEVSFPSLPFLPPVE
jgi:hypothetical protein